MTTRPCPVCAGAQAQQVLALEQPVPVFCNVLHDDVRAGRGAPIGRLVLVVCLSCGHLFNDAHEEALVAYGTRYENSLHFSPTFQEYATHLARRLVAEHRLVGGSALEVGSGKGDFLALLVEQGLSRAVGYDPSYAAEQDHRTADGRIRFVRALLPEQIDDLDVDLLCARHVLEHLEQPRDVVATLRPAFAVGRRTVLYAEVPDGGYLLEQTALWDLIYEHPSHFTGASLHRLLAQADVPVTALDTSFGGQYLWAEATARSERSVVPAPVVDDVLQAAAGFAARASATVDHWAEQLDELTTSGRRAALWGSGSKGVTFLNTVPGADLVELVVDVNPRKHGKHVPGTGQRVIGPRDLVATPPDVVVVLNPLYVPEVRAELRRLGLSADVRLAGTEARSG